MSFKKRFESLANQWVRHCENTMLSSDIRDYLNHSSYRDLVALGSEALPYIMDRYHADEFTPWGFLLDDITGVAMIENCNRFKPAEIRERWLTWWQTNKQDVSNKSSISSQSEAIEQAPITKR